MQWAFYLVTCPSFPPEPLPSYTGQSLVVTPRRPLLTKEASTPSLGRIPLLLSTTHCFCLGQPLRPPASVCGRPCSSHFYLGHACPVQPCLHQPRSSPCLFSIYEFLSSKAQRHAVSNSIYVLVYCRVLWGRSLVKASYMTLYKSSVPLSCSVVSNSLWSHGSQPCLTQWNYEPCRVGPPKMDGSQWRILTKCGPLEKGMANHFNIPALRTPWTVQVIHSL